VFEVSGCVCVYMNPGWVVVLWLGMQNVNDGEVVVSCVIICELVEGSG
jgi:hypothetical protein